MKFQIERPYQPTADQARAIAEIVEGLCAGRKHQVLHGITGVGKTFVMANVIEATQRPTLVMTHNETLLDQLHAEFKRFFPNNAVEYFQSDYLIYQPQSYGPRTDKYLDKRAALDDEITRQRMKTVVTALTRRDTIVVSTVSCNFDIGSPQVCRDLALPFVVGQEADLDDIIARLTKTRYKPAGTPMDYRTYRRHGHGIDVYPPHDNLVYRITVRDGKVTGLTTVDPESDNTVEQHRRITVYPACLHILRDGWIEAALPEIKEELDGRLRTFRSQGRMLEAQRLEAATLWDLKLLRERGYCPGIENYCRAVNRRAADAPPDTLLDYLPKDLLVFVDESHRAVPQIRGMYEGNQQTRGPLVTHGYRLPSAMDFRPLRFDEWEEKVNQVVFVSATPGDEEMELAGGAVVPLVTRPYGQLDPLIEVEPREGHLTHLVGEIHKRIAVNEGILVMATTKRQAEDVAAYLAGQSIRCEWLHEELERDKRKSFLDGLQEGRLDAIVGVALLREGINLPRVSLVAVLDADDTKAPPGMRTAKRSCTPTGSPGP
jgi:excinuclease ABC subunit B